jgi:4-hydroxy-3-polyprenylbenzoate decarboxylase
VRRLIVGISGSSGAIYGVRLLELVREFAPGVETHLVISKGARATIAHELELTVREVAQSADVVYAVDNLGAAISSGSFATAGMIVAPCSIRSLSAIANSAADNLLIRAADVSLKERRPLVLLVRETPLHLGHLRLMTAATEHGAIVMPPVPAFYHRPNTIGEIVDHTLMRALDMVGIATEGIAARWDSPGSHDSARQQPRSAGPSSR